FLAKSPGRQRSAGVVSIERLVLISSLRVQTIYGIVRRRRADCPIAFRIRPAQHRADSTSSVSWGPECFAQLGVPLLVRERSRRPQRDLERPLASDRIRLADRKAKGCAASPWTRSPSLRSGRRRSPPEDDIR